MTKKILKLGIIAGIGAILFTGCGSAKIAQSGSIADLKKEIAKPDYTKEQALCDALKDTLGKTKVENVEFLINEGANPSKLWVTGTNKLTGYKWKKNALYCFTGEYDGFYQKSKLDQIFELVMITEPDLFATTGKTDTLKPGWSSTKFDQSEFLVEMTPYDACIDRLRHSGRNAAKVSNHCLRFHKEMMNQNPNFKSYYFPLTPKEVQVKYGDKFYWKR